MEIVYKALMRAIQNNKKICILTKNYKEEQNIMHGLIETALDIPLYIAIKEERRISFNNTSTITLISINDEYRLRGTNFDFILFQGDITRIKKFYVHYLVPIFAIEEIARKKAENLVDIAKKDGITIETPNLAIFEVIPE